MKEAILVASFGTSYPETREKTIQAVTEKIAEAYPSHIIETAFTSNIIRRVLAKRETPVFSADEAMESLLERGVTHVTVQPTHLICGDEFDKLCGLIKPFQNRFESIKIGLPLLATTDDLERVADFLGTEYPMNDGEALVLMGHGTEHPIKHIYPDLQKVCNQKHYNHIYIGTVEGDLELEPLIPKLKEAGVKKVVLAPLMLVAGDHATNDMASDEEDSWMTILTNAGFETTAVLRGLGEYEAIQDLYLEHLQAATEFSF